jgi:hypothetical protein
MTGVQRYAEALRKTFQRFYSNQAPAWLGAWSPGHLWNSFICPDSVIEDLWSPETLGLWLAETRWSRYMTPPLSIIQNGLIENLLTGTRWLLPGCRRVRAIITVSQFSKNDWFLV